MSLFGIIASGISGHLSNVFSSLYESFQDLTSVQSQHFVEWFSGSALSSTWTTANQDGTNTFRMSDEVDGGFEIVTGATTNAQGNIGFNNKRPYEPTDYTLIATVKKTTATNCGTSVGISSNHPSLGTPANYVICTHTTAESFIRLSSGDGTTGSAGYTDVAPHENWYNVKLVGDGTDNKLYLDGVLKLTKTTNLATVKCQPYFDGFTYTTSSVKTQIRYLELYNNTVPITSSLYETLSPLTQVAGQRVVENFSGSALQSQRWTYVDVSGTGSGAMDDSVDGGYKITPATSSNNRSSIWFNGKKQYDPADCVVVAVWKFSNSTCRTQVGISNSANVITGGSKFINSGAGTGNTNFSLMRSNGTYTTTEGSVTLDANYHTHKLDCGSGTCSNYIDGVIDVTATTQLPTVGLCPILSCEDIGAGTANANFLYYEAYNKLTTETDYPSVYELFNPLTTVAKSHFWEWFSGNNYDTTRWTIRNHIGTATFQMSDSVDGGFEIVTSTTSNSAHSMDFNDKRHYDPVNSVAIAVISISALTTSQVRAGLTNTTGVNLDYAYSGFRASSSANFSINTADGSTVSITAGSIVADTNFHSLKTECGSASIKMYVDGVLDVTKTTNRPTAKMQPVFVVTNDSGTSSRTARIRYMEAYNT